MTSQRFIRPRLLLRPLVFGLLVTPIFLRTTVPAAPRAMKAGAVCTNVEEREVLPPPSSEMSSGPNCASCRAPLLDGPLAHLDRKAGSAAPPAA